MMDAGVEAHLELVRADQNMTVRAFVAAAPARPLRWRLTTLSRTVGGTSNVSQSGSTQGVSDQPVSVTVVSPNSEGTVVLVVFDGDQEIARDTLDLSRSASDVP